MIPVVVCASSIHSPVEALQHSSCRYAVRIWTSIRRICDHESISQNSLPECIDRSGLITYRELRWQSDLETRFSFL
jgi:hypothetical protein